MFVTDIAPFAMGLLLISVCLLFVYTFEELYALISACGYRLRKLSVAIFYWLSILFVGLAAGPLSRAAFTAFACVAVSHLILTAICPDMYTSIRRPSDRLPHKEEGQDHQ